MKILNSGEPLQRIGAAGLDDVEKAVFAYVQLRHRIDASMPEIMAESGFSEEDIARAMALLPAMAALIERAHAAGGAVLIEKGDLYTEQ